MSESNISGRLLKTTHLDDSIFVDLQSRDVALWLGPAVGVLPNEVDAVAALASLPWQIVLCESQSAVLASKMEELKDDRRLVGHRGFLDVIAANPEEIPLPSQTLPVFMLNGREGTDDPLEKPNLTRQKQQLRRLNMLKRLQDDLPRHLVVVSAGDGSAIEELAELWEEGFRARLTLVTTSADDIGQLESGVISKFRLDAVTHVEQSAADFASDLVARSRVYIDTEKLIVRVRDLDKNLHALDASACERPDQPILDRYDLILEKHLANVQPEELSEQELDEFFHRSSSAWRPYSAHLPWIKDDLAERQMLKLLRKVHVGGSEENRILLLQSEAGAGGTTLLKHLAFVAAKNGYPALVARQIDFDPDANELTGFLHSLHSTRIEAAELSVREDA